MQVFCASFLRKRSRTAAKLLHNKTSMTAFSARLLRKTSTTAFSTRLLCKTSMTARSFVPLFCANNLGPPSLQVSAGLLRKTSVQIFGARYAMYSAVQATCASLQCKICDVYEYCYVFSDEPSAVPSGKQTNIIMEMGLDDWQLANALSFPGFQCPMSCLLY